MDELHEIRAFVEVAHTGSFLRAAPVLGCTTSAVSKAVSRLEDRLGVRLVARTTRRLALTEEGARYLQECEDILDRLAAASDAITAQQHATAGVVRVELPLIWGRRHVLEHLPAFRAEFPAIRLCILFTDRAALRFDHRIDVSIRVGASEEAGIVSKPLLATRAILVASPSYLALRGAPASIEELAQHACIHYLDPASLTPVPWLFGRDGQTLARVFAHSLMLNNPDAMGEAARLGLGIVQGPEFIFAEALQAGRLQRVLPAFATEGPAVHITWPQNRYLPRRVRVFIDWVSRLAAAEEHAPASTRPAVRLRYASSAA